jgi:NitT/TauT family transport system permease protein
MSSGGGRERGGVTTTTTTMTTTTTTTNTKEKKKPKFKIVALQGVAILAFLLAWQALRSLNVVSKLFLAAPSELLSGSWLGVLPSFTGALWSTILIILVSFLATAAIGVTLGILLGHIDFAFQVLEPFIVWGYSVPKIIIFPLFLITFGLGVNTVIAYAVIGPFFVILLNVLSGVHDMDKQLLLLADSLGMSTLEKYWKFVLPYIVPVTFSGLRQALIQTVIEVLIAELLITTLGVGGLINQLTFSFETVQLFAVVTILALIMIFVNLSLLKIESRLGSWRA